MKHNSSAKKRSGFTLIAVLVCIGVATSIFLGCLTISLRQHRQARRELQKEQTRWLLDAGVRHAMTKLKHEPDFDAETIVISPAISKFEVAAIEISLVPEKKLQSNTIEEPVELTNSVKVRVTARLTHDNFTTRQSYEFNK